jgi:uncharacterized protein (TIGR00297 family)
MIQLLVFLFSLVVGYFSYQRKSISKSGFIALMSISSLFIFSNQIELLAIIFYMFASSSLLSKLLPHQQELEDVIDKTGARDYIQALANLGVASLLFCFYLISWNTIYIIGFISSVVAANADSWASEIGGLSKRTPVLITNFQPIKKGISGGITLIGTIGGILGGLFIIVLSYITLYHSNLSSIISPHGWIAILIGGISGLFIDSYLGAWFQALYKENKILNETQQGKLIKGHSWITNDMVNFMTTFSSALMSIIIYFFFL